MTDREAEVEHLAALLRRAQIGAWDKIGGPFRPFSRLWVSHKNEYRAMARAVLRDRARSRQRGRAKK